MMAGNILEFLLVYNGLLILKYFYLDIIFLIWKGMICMIEIYRNRKIFLVMGMNLKFFRILLVFTWNSIDLGNF